MASDRFKKFSEADVKSFTEERENAHTKKTSYNQKLFKELLASDGKRREMKKIQPPSCKNSQVIRLNCSPLHAC